METHVVIDIPRGVSLSDEELAFVRKAHRLYQPAYHSITLTASLSVVRMRTPANVTVEEVIAFARTHPQWVQWPKIDDVLDNIATLQLSLDRAFRLLAVLEEQQAMT